MARPGWSFGGQRVLYPFGGVAIAMRDVATGQLTYLHRDHLGSVATTTVAGALRSWQEFTPWGEVRAGNVPETALDFTGQRRDGTGLLFYQARYYDSALGLFLSPDTIVPGTASGAGGAAATVGPDAGAGLAALTVGFHEPGFNATLGQEHRGLLGAGFFGRESPRSAGPANPQALNRYAYVLNNPVRYTDPTGHCGPQCVVAGAAGTAICGPICGAVLVAIVAVLSAGTAIALVSDIAQSTDYQASAKSLVEGDPQLDVHLDRINRTDDFIKYHPDIASDAEAERQGRPPPPGRNHADEARHWINSLDKAIAQLIRKYREYDVDGQSKILEAINKAKSRRQQLQEKLDGK